MYFLRIPLMKNIVYLKCFILLLIYSSQNVNAQEIGKESQSNPINPGKMVYPVKIGLFGGINSTVLPSEMVNKPTTATKDVQQSLLNGFDGLGFGQTINFGIIAKYPLSESFYFGAGIEYSGWKSENSCNCNNIVDNSQNSLSLLHFGLLSQYYLLGKLYTFAELGLNFLGAKVNENSNRGKLDFTKSYTRIGAGLGVGCEFPLMNNFALDITAKGHFPNLLLGQENTGTNTPSESLISATGETKESTLFILSLNIGLLFSL
jgi:opacity protein-like surface antigen